MAVAKEAASNVFETVANPDRDAGIVYLLSNDRRTTAWLPLDQQERAWVTTHEVTTLLRERNVYMNHGRTNLGRVLRKLVVAAAMITALASCSSTTTSQPPSAKPTIATPGPVAVAATFNGCGDAKYAFAAISPGIPRPGSTNTPTTIIPGSTPSPTPAGYGAPATSNDALSYVHQIMSLDSTVSHDTISCGAKLFSAGAVASYLNLAKTPPGSVYAVVAQVQPAASGQTGQVRVYFLDATNPLLMYSAQFYPANAYPDIFKGI